MRCFTLLLFLVSFFPAQIAPLKAGVYNKLQQIGNIDENEYFDTKMKNLVKKKKL